MGTWGYTGTGTTTTTATNICRHAYGEFAPGANKTLVSVHINMSGVSAGDSRVAVHQNSSLSTDGATLLEDLGTFARADGWNVINSTTNPTLTNGTYLIISCKTNDTAGNYTRTDAAAEDIDRICTDADPDENETSAWDDPLVAGSSILTRALSFYITYSDIAGPSVITEGFRFRNHDGDETAATWAAAQDANHSVTPRGRTRLRFVVQVPEAGQYRLEAAEVGTDNWFIVPVE